MQIGFCKFKRISGPTYISILSPTEKINMDDIIKNHLQNYLQNFEDYERRQTVIENRVTVFEQPLYLEMLNGRMISENEYKKICNEGSLDMNECINDLDLSIDMNLMPIEYTKINYRKP